MRPTQLLAAVVAMASVTNALSGAFDNVHGLDGVKNILLGRQDDQKDASSQAPQSSAPRTSDKPTATQSNDNKDSSATSGQASGSAKASGSQGSKTTTGKTKSTSIDPRVPAGGVSMVTPNALAGPQYYKVGNGNFITFAWNYTSLSVTPSAIDVMASCSANQATYTIAVNISAEQTQVIWDTNTTPSGQPPFLTEKYTLLIMDAEADVTAAPRPGYLGVFNQFTFGMYTPQPYVNWTDFQCANCVKNGALSHSEKMTLKVLLFTSGTTVASLLYFAHNFGLW
jgi:hypothetical protein